MQNFLFKRLLQTTFKSNPFSSPQSHSPLFKFLASGLGATGLGSVFYHYKDMKNFSNKNNFTEMDQTQTPDHVFKDLAKGTIYGALCGDSIGSFVEFEDYVSGSKAEHALTMPGGGPFSLAKGQITDDGELALCLGQGLVDGKGEFDVNKIAENYKKWITSNPFDVGITIGTAFHWANPAGLAKGYRKSSLQSGKSQSNGALMRISPLCVWVAKLSKEDLKKCVREDTRLTHPNKTAIDVSIAYVYAIQHLLNNKGDSEGAYKKAFEMIKELDNPEVEEWLRELEKGELPPANEKIGWVKIAFLYSLQFLKQKKGYADAMKIMLEQAGDTDTNCCIVGAMIGALHGFDAIPKEMTDAVKTCNPAAGGIRRPDFLLAEKSLDKIIDGILETMPKGEVIIKGAETEEEKAENNKKGFW